MERVVVGCLCVLSGRVCVLLWREVAEVLIGAGWMSDVGSSGVGRSVMWFWRGGWFRGGGRRVGGGGVSCRLGAGLLSVGGGTIMEL